MVVCNEFEVPRTAAPPVPKHQTNPLDSLVNEFRRAAAVTAAAAPSLAESSDNEMVIVGPAETISGLIDTRPLEARKPIIIKHPVPSPTDSIDEIKESVLIDRCGNGNNQYQLMTASNQSPAAAHARHQSLSMPNAPASVPKSITTPQFHGAGLMDGKVFIAATATTRGSVAAAADLMNGNGPGHQQQPHQQAGSKQSLLYENVSINNKDCNVPYENINLEYIARLVSEGYSKESAITALGISRNNIEMACDILHEFVSKSSV